MGGSYDIVFQKGRLLAGVDDRIRALLTRLLTGAETERDREALHDLRPDRSFTAEEALK